MLFNGDCLEVMKTLDDKSIDLVFCDLPYGQTSCKWDCKIDLEEFWKQIMRIKKLNTPLFFTTTTKFGVELIQSAPKKCPFRYDLVWVKSASAGFLCAKKMPMRKHEMIYVFYEKLPFYDLSRHTHKFIKKEEDKYIKDTDKEYKTCYGGVNIPKHPDSGARWEPPLPVSVVKEPDNPSEGGSNGSAEPEPEPEGEDDYKEGIVYKIPFKKSENADKQYQKLGRKNNESAYDPPLPNTLLEINSTRGKHSTEKPVALMEWILSYYSKEGDIILDPTMGSGSTGVACKNLNRKFIGIELDKEIFEVANQRLA